MAVDVITYAAKQRRVADVAGEAFQTWIAENPGAGLAEIREQVTNIASMYGEAAAELAIEYYMDARSAVEGIVDWEPQPVEGFSEKYMARRISQAYDPDDSMRGMLDLINEAVQQSGRNTVSRNARRDPAKARWARMPIGKTCAFCLMLASRGAVYFTKQKAGGTGNGTNYYHAVCDCQPVPVWPGQQPPYDADELYNLYRQSADRAGGSSPSAIAAQMRRDYPDIVNDGATPGSTRTGGPGSSRPTTKPTPAPKDYTSDPDWLRLQLRNIEGNDTPWANQMRDEWTKKLNEIDPPAASVVKKQPVVVKPVPGMEALDKRLGAGAGQYATEALDEVIQQYPELNGWLRSVTVDTRHSGNAVAGYTPGRRDMTFYKRQMDVTTIAEQVRREHRIGSWSTDAPEHIVRHEMGHALADQHRAFRGKQGGVFGDDDKYYELQAVYNETLKYLFGSADVGRLFDGRTAIGRANIAKAGTVLSSYGLGSVEEMIAESFAEVMAGNPRDFARTIIDIVTRESS